MSTDTDTARLGQQAVMETLPAQGLFRKYSVGAALHFARGGEREYIYGSTFYQISYMSWH